MERKQETLIIRRGYSQKTGGRTVFLAVAAGYLGWLAYLFKGLIILAGWGAAWGLTDLAAPQTSAEEVLQQIAAVYAPLFLAMAGFIWIWGFYNWLRFRGANDRRRKEKHISYSLQDISEACSLKVDDLVRMRENSLGVLHFDDDGKIRRVESLGQKMLPGAPSSVPKTDPARQ